MNILVLKYKGYTGSVEYCEEDKSLYGHVLGMHKHFISFQGDANLETLEADFRAAIDDYLEDCKKNGVEPQKHYTGRLNIRISSEVHGRIARLSKERGISINKLINQALRTI